jgi:DNA-binding MarR family transcriptional regulator
MSRSKLILGEFLPYQLSITSNAVSEFIARSYRGRFGLKIPEWRVMAVLGERASATQRELVAATQMDKVTVNRASKALVERGLIGRAPNETDGRSHHLALTPVGRNFTRRSSRSRFRSKPRSRGYWKRAKRRSLSPSLHGCARGSARSSARAADRRGAGRRLRKLVAIVTIYGIRDSRILHNCLWMILPMPDLFENPLGLDGFEFVEFCAPQKGILEPVFESMGFTCVARHRSKDVHLWRQGEINLIANYEPRSPAAYFAAEHGPSACGMAFRVKDAARAYKEAIERGAEPVESKTGVMELRIPAIKGIGGAFIYLVDRYATLEHPDALSIYDIDFAYLPGVEHFPAGAGFKSIDHLTHNVYGGRMAHWAGVV